MGKAVFYRDVYLLKLNIKQGKDVALKLEQALEFVLYNPTKNNKHDILNFLFSI